MVGLEWVRRIGRGPVASMAAAGQRTAGPTQERLSPGIRALFERMPEDRSRAILDLGAADGNSLAVYGRFARWVRFAEVLGPATSLEGWPAALRTIPPNPERPYDLVIAWDILDRLPAEGRRPLVERLTELSGPEAVLFLVIAESAPRPPELFSFSLADAERMRYGRSGEPHPPDAPLLPAEVARVLAPFSVTRAFSTQVGFREYVGVR